MENSEKIRVSKQFFSDFETVTKHYECSENEIDWLKKQARKDYEMVSKSMEIMVDEINGKRPFPYQTKRAIV